MLMLCLVNEERADRPTISGHGQVTWAFQKAQT